MKTVKQVVLLIVTIVSTSTFGQTSKITKLLQETLIKENKASQLLQNEIDSLGNEVAWIKQDIDSLHVTEPFLIKNDTLIYTIKKKLSMENGYFLEQQVVALKDVIAITKDIGIFFESKPGKVILTRREYFDDGNYVKTSVNVELFRTHFVSLRENEYLADEFVKAFKNAGYTIEKGFWYD